MKPQITAYCLDWHINSSSAFYDLLVLPLKPYAEIQLTVWNGNSTTLQSNWKEGPRHSPIIFCQRPPSAEFLEIRNAHLVWIPMWDSVVLKWSSDEWWKSLPKTLRVVAFSEAVAQKSESAGLPTLRLKYFKNPENFNPAKWDGKRKLMYWNRTGLFGPSFLRKLCETLDIDELYFRGTTDPKMAYRATYALPPQMGRTIVHEVPRLESQDDYFRILANCNIYLAPRAAEGVGLTFLEAMASGCAVLGYDAPTMNEHIAHMESGYLFPASSLKKISDSPIDKIRLALGISAKGKDSPAGTRRPLYRVSEDQDWDQLRELDLKSLGNTAQKKQWEGFSTWNKRLKDFAHFILDW